MIMDGMFDYCNSCSNLMDFVVCVLVALVRAK